MDELIFAGLYLLVLFFDFIPLHAARERRINVLYGLLLAVSGAGLVFYKMTELRFALTGVITAGVSFLYGGGG